MRGLRNSGSALVIGSALVLSTPVLAQQFDKNIYLGVGALGSTLEPRVNESAFRIAESQSFGGLVSAGADLNTRLSLEGYYRYLGEAGLRTDSQTGTIGYQTVGLSGLLYLFGSQGYTGLRNRTGVMLYGRAGVGYLDNSSEDVEFLRLQSTHVTVGAGLEYGFENGFGLRAEFLNHDADARDFSVSIVKRFGRAGEVNLTPEPVVDVVSEAPAEIVNDPVSTIADNTGPVAAPIPPPPIPNWDKDGDGVLDTDDQCANTPAGTTVDRSGCSFSGVLEGVTFASGSAELTAAATQILDQIVSELAANGKIEIAVHSHTDNRGSAAANMGLSRRRAVSVVRYLADVGGIDLARMSAVGFGESRPVQSNRTEAGRQANRRVEIVVK